MEGGDRNGGISNGDTNLRGVIGFLVVLSLYVSIVSTATSVSVRLRPSNAAMASVSFTIIRSLGYHQSFLVSTVEGRITSNISHTKDNKLMYQEYSLK